MGMKRLLGSALTLVLLLTFSLLGRPGPTVQPVAHAEPAGEIYYVSPTGNDDNPGTAEEPWQTLAKAAAEAAATAFIFRILPWGQ